MVKIGIPGALFFFLYYPMWKTFFNELGCQVITSGETTKEILNLGVREALADACLPLKLFFGHAAAIKNKVDYFFIPRIVCLNKKTVYCPKFLGLPDMIRHGLPEVPPVIDTRIDTRDKRWAVFRAFLETGKMLGAKKTLITRAYIRSIKKLYRYNKLLRTGWQPLKAMTLVEQRKIIRPQRDENTTLTFAVLGFPYVVHDRYINIGLLEKLKRLGVKPITVENLAPGFLARQKCNLEKRLFWTFSDLILRAAHYFFQRQRVDGVIHLTTFGCGPDSLLNKLIELTAKEHKETPFMTLTIDEHTGEAGMNTRLEAFVDMVLRKKKRGFTDA